MTDTNGKGRPGHRVLSTRTIVLTGVGLFLAGCGMAVWLLLAYGQGGDADRTSLEAIKTAGTIVIGTGGLGALWLAARRQQSTELGIQQKERDQQQAELSHALQERAATVAEADAAERRITELYTKAADQLGSDKAPVRLAGMYALERLAEKNPDQRQTIVNVLCAYLRMPYSTETEGDGQQLNRNEHHEQERQVRLTVQRILANHLHSSSIDEFWGNQIDIDLTGATLLDFSFTNCEVRTATFDHAKFLGTAKFDRAKFRMVASFHRAKFGRATFANARFDQKARFIRTKFEESVSFFGAIFGEETAWFTGATLTRSSFDGAIFSKGARFEFAKFKDATFCHARFRNAARFDGSQFAEETLFLGAWFSGEASFDRAQLDEEFEYLFLLGARARVDVPDKVYRVWPKGWSIAETIGGEGEDENPEEGRWGQLVPAMELIIQESSDEAEEDANS